jgi:dimeric dUTPase (all-alpha-NTP-PPase superfamily)
MSDAKDMLQDLFDKQMALNRRIGVNPPDMNDEEKVRWVLNYTRAASQELAELVDSVPWKWWANYQEFDVQNAKVEVVDLFHFLISLAQVLGMDAGDVHDLYNQKNKLNFKRQDDGYATKDEDDNRALNVER